MDLSSSGERSNKISPTNIVGFNFNILRFDIPLLIQKGVEYGVGGLAELNKLWHDTYTTIPRHKVQGFEGRVFGQDS